MKRPSGTGGAGYVLVVTCHAFPAHTFHRKRVPTLPTLCAPSAHFAAAFAAIALWRWRSTERTVTFEASPALPAASQPLATTPERETQSPYGLWLRASLKSLRRSRQVSSVWGRHVDWCAAPPCTDPSAFIIERHAWSQRVRLFSLSGGLLPASSIHIRQQPLRRIAAYVEPTRP